MKRAMMVAVIVIFSLSMISAAGIEIELQGGKTEFFQEELLQAEILGAFKENLALENIALYEGNKVHATPTQSNLLKLSSKYIYYAVLSGAVGNYSVKISGIEYYVGQELSDSPVIQNITVISTTEPYLSISPGFISATGDFSIKIKSMNAAQSVTAKFKATGEELTKDIGYNQARDFTFSISELEEYTESEIEVGDYVIPAYIYPAEPGEEQFAPDAGGEEAENESEQEEPEEIPYEEATPEQIQSCADIDGKLCKKGEKCVGPTSFAKDIVCCLGECEEKSGWGWIIGIAILVALVGGGAWFYVRAKKFGRSKSEEQTLEEKSAKFKERMGMFKNLKPEAEIRGGLSRE